MSDSVWPRKRQPIRLPHPWDSPGKNTGVGCHFLLQCMKVKSESKVSQSCPTLSGPMDCSLPGSSIHGIFQARVLEWVAIAFSDRGNLFPHRSGGWKFKIKVLAGWFFWGVSPWRQPPSITGVVAVWSSSYAWFFVSLWTVTHQVPLSLTLSRSLLKLMSLMLSNHLILCLPFLLLPSIFFSIRVFSNELALCIRWSKYWSFSFCISPSNEYSGLIFL